jgi:bifunctional DNase/RNase
LGYRNRTANRYEELIGQRECRAHRVRIVLVFWVLTVLGRIDKGGTYFARLFLSAESELQQKKIIEIDARPSDCIAMATQQPAPIYVSLDVWDKLEDMTEALRTMQQEGSHTEESDEEEES